ncbi:MAG: arginine--tRNA ligase [Bifidobacteriaceae bacterium]|jgi:arginyl-tRNA synthetase|nr:arginine--tRNA ligase [Bifidobacteriaceae bacterium]
MQEKIIDLIKNIILKEFGQECQPELEIPADPKNGDYATNIALKSAKLFGKNPREIATVIADVVAKSSPDLKCEIAGPGFINFYLNSEDFASVVINAIKDGDSYGKNDSLKGDNINLEFVSANPTGPLHIGGTRWAAVGDALANIFESCGASVHREYYFNDHGSQIDNFVYSLLAAYKNEPTPENGYGGDYIKEIASTISDSLDKQITNDADLYEYFRKEGTTIMFAEIQKSLEDFGVNFDEYFHEQSLYDTNDVDTAINKLKAAGAMYEKDGALWFESTKFGDDKDRVVIKSDGEYAYLAADIAYYLNKRNRGYNRVFYMLGSDHHGYIGRLKAIALAFGDSLDNIEIIIGQLVNLIKDGKPFRMSKRNGDIVSLEDMVEIAGVDATRYSLARYSINQSIDLDLDLISSHSSDNPVFYVQYAHARCSNIIKNAASYKLIASIDNVNDNFDGSLLDAENEVALLKKLSTFEDTIKEAAEFYAPHRIARYAEELAAALHKFYGESRIIPASANADTPITEPVYLSRLYLVHATKQVLANSLSLLGVTAPEKM